eukprot:364367-Chlamydomonas_euryale.AAC.2
MAPPLGGGSGGDGDGVSVESSWRLLCDGELHAAKLALEAVIQARPDDLQARVLLVDACLELGGEPGSLEEAAEVARAGEDGDVAGRRTCVPSVRRGAGDIGLAKHPRHVGPRGGSIGYAKGLEMACGWCMGDGLGKGFGLGRVGSGSKAEQGRGHPVRRRRSYLCVVGR